MDQDNPEGGETTELVQPSLSLPSLLLLESPLVKSNQEPDGMGAHYSIHVGELLGQKKMENRARGASGKHPEQTTCLEKKHQLELQDSSGQPW